MPRGDPRSRKGGTGDAGVRKGETRDVFIREHGGEQFVTREHGGERFVTREHGGDFVVREDATDAPARWVAEDGSLTVGPHGSRKRRPGPRMRVHPDLRDAIIELRNPWKKPPVGLNEREIADALRMDGRFGDDDWDGPRVRRLLRAIRAERADFLERITLLLDEIRRSGGLTRGGLVDLCTSREFDRYWLWDRFGDRRITRIGDGDQDLAPPLVVDHESDRVTVTAAGEALAYHWKAIAGYPGEALDVLAVVSLGLVSPEGLPDLCKRYHASMKQLIDARLVETTPKGGGLRLTETGDTAGSQWAFDDGQAGLHAVIEGIYWPTSYELRALPAEWDWKHRPLLPQSPQGFLTSAR